MVCCSPQNRPGLSLISRRRRIFPVRPGPNKYCSRLSCQGDQVLQESRRRSTTVQEPAPYIVLGDCYCQFGPLGHPGVVGMFGDTEGGSHCKPIPVTYGMAS